MQESREERVNITEHQVLTALKTKYPPPAYAFFAHVGNSTGFATRIADAIVMSLYPSRGLTIAGFEIKVSRSDWLRERSDPAKAEAIAQHCDHWWIAAAAGVVNPDELPPNWGLIVAKSTGTGPDVLLRVRREAKQLKGGEKLHGSTRGFIASLMREIHQSYVPAADVESRVRDELKVQILRNTPPQIVALERQVKDLQQENAALRAAANEFSQASGVTLKSGWEGRKVGLAFKRFIDTDDVEVQQMMRLRFLHKELKDVIATLEPCLKEGAVHGG